MSSTSGAASGGDGQTGGRREAPVTVPDFAVAKRAGRKLTVLTAYDCTSARLLDAAGVDALLVGDSLGMVCQGEPHSLGVTLRDMVYHTRMVARGARRALVVADLPFLTYRSPAHALRNAGRLVQKGGAHAVKLEGGERSVQAIEAVTRAEIPVMGHIGLTPQSVRKLGGFRVQRDAKALVADARAVEAAGAFALVVECVPVALAAEITQAVSIPTIGIGAGPACDGQVLVTHDLLGLLDDFRPRFAKAYANLSADIRAAVAAYCHDVRTGRFPGPEHGY